MKSIVTDTTPEADRPGDPAPQIDFTVYVVSIPQSAVVATGATAVCDVGGAPE